MASLLSMLEDLSKLLDPVARLIKPKDEEEQTTSPPEPVELAALDDDYRPIRPVTIHERKRPR